MNLQTSMEQFFSKNIDQNHFYTNAEASKMFERLTQERGEGTSLSDWNEFRELLARPLMFEEHTYTHKGEEEMLHMIRAALEPVFKEGGSDDNGTSHFHVFVAAQNIFLRASQLNYTNLLRYMLDNLKIEEHDVDRFVLYAAMKRGSWGAVEMICDSVDAEIYGKGKNAPLSKTFEENMNSLPNLKDAPERTKHKLSSKFGWLNLKDETA